MFKKNFVTHLLFLVVFLFIAIYITYPVIFQLTTHTTSLGDEYIITWIQNWVIHSLFTNPLQLFHAPFFHPYPYTLAYSDVFITSSIFAAPFLLMLKQPVVTFNVTLITSIGFLGFSLYLLSWYLTKEKILSFFVAILVIFSPAVLDKMTHLQILNIWGVPLAILFFIRFLSERKILLFAVAITVLVLQTYNSFLPGYFIAFSFVIISITTYFADPKKLKVLLNKKIFFVLLFASLSLLPIIIPYYKVSLSFNYSRDIRDAIHLGLNPEDLLVGNSYTNLEPYLKTYFPQTEPPGRNEIKVGFIGGVFSILLSLAFLFLIVKRLQVKKYQFYYMFTGVSLFGLITSLGPVLHLFRETIHQPFPIVLPYALFYYLVPGFNGFRNSARWEMLFIIAGAVVVGLFLLEIKKNMSQKIFTICLLLLISGVFLEFRNPDRFVPIKQTQDFPKIYAEIASLPKDAVIIHLPIYNWYMSGIERERTYFSIIHFRKTVNGSSGFSPAEWEKRNVFLMNSFPNIEAINVLKRIGVTHVVIHSKEYDEMNRRIYKIAGKTVSSSSAILNSIRSETTMDLLKNIEGDYLFEL